MMQTAAHRTEQTGVVKSASTALDVYSLENKMEFTTDMGNAMDD